MASARPSSRLRRADRHGGLQHRDDLHARLGKPATGQRNLTAYQVIFFLAVVWAVVVHELAISKSPLGVLGPTIVPILEWFVEYISDLRRGVTLPGGVPGSYRAQGQGGGPRSDQEALVRRSAGPTNDQALRLLKAVVDTHAKLQKAHEPEIEQSKQDFNGSLEGARRFVILGR
jgi:hypothetical protein